MFKRNKKSNNDYDDQFTKTAIIFILGVVVGFALLLMGLIFLMLAVLSTAVDEADPPAWVYLILAGLSATIGIYMMKYSLSDVPEPGTFK